MAQASGQHRMLHSSGTGWRMEPEGSHKLTVQRFASVPERKTPESKHWKKFKLRAIEKQIAPATHIAFSPVAPFDYAVSASTRVIIYDGQTDKVKRTISRFHDVAFSGSFRYDGKVLVAGSANGDALLFDVASRTVLRTFKGHEGEVRLARISAENQVMTGSNDTTVRCWDVASGSQLSVLRGHTDYVRCGTLPVATPNIWITGSYDHTVRLWDVRSGSAAQTIDHGHPVEDVTVFPQGGMLISAGGPVVKVWDLLGGGRLLYTVANHQKTVTQVLLDGTGTKLLSASLDRHVKVYDTSRDYRVLHSMKYPEGVLAMALSPDDTHLVVSMTDATVNIRRRTLTAEEGAEEQTRRRRLYGNTHRFFVRGRAHRPSQDDFVFHQQRREHLQPYEQLLRKFRYQKALNAALQTRNPTVVISMLHELVFRGELRTALADRNEDSLVPLLRFAVRYVSDPRYTTLIWELINTMLDLYAPLMGSSPTLDELFMRLRNQLRSELEFQKDVYALMGQLEMLMAAAGAAEGVRTDATVAPPDGRGAVPAAVL